MGGGDRSDDAGALPLGGAVLSSSRRSQFSPLRYPGGKSWLVPLALRWLAVRPHRVLLEPFAGGASVGLAAAASGLVDEVVLVELDHEVAGFWKVVLESPRQLAMLVRGTPRTNGALAEVLRATPRLEVERAFQLLVRNRVARGGVLAPGAGVLKAGEDGRGLTSRWYPETLAERIELIPNLPAKVTIVEGCGLEECQRRAGDEKTAVFADPPYAVERDGAGHRLYTYSEVDHERLLGLASSCAGDVLVAYDATAKMAELASAHGLEHRTVAMRGTRGVVQQEILLGKDLAWLGTADDGPLAVAQRQRPQRRSPAHARRHPRKRDDPALVERLTSSPELSDRAIGAELGVAARTVAEARRALVARGVIGTAATRTGRDGVVRALPGDALGRVIRYLRANPTAAAETDRCLARELAVSRSTVAEGRRRMMTTGPRSG